MSSDHSLNATDRILLTGATSYLGVNLAARLLEEGVDVHAVVRENSDTSRLAALPGGITCHRLDGGVETLAAIMASVAPTTVVHLASRYVRDHGIDDVDGLIEDNISFGTRLLEAMHLAEVRRIVCAGSFFQFFDSAAYRPVNLYAATKQAFDDILAYYRDAHGFSTASLILYDIYGPGDWRPKLMSVLRDALRSGETVDLVEADTPLDIVYIDDVVEAFVHAIGRRIEGGPFAVSGTDRPCLGQVVDVMNAYAGKKISANFGAYELPLRTPTRRWDGPALPDWFARIGLQEGVQKFLDEVV